MNHVYRLKRSGRTQQLQPVPETARAAGKGTRTGKTLAQTVTATLASVALGGVATLAYAQQAPPAANQLPQGGVVTRGSAHIVTSTSGSTALMSVNQSSQRAVIDWTSFNVGSQAKVQFNQPSSSAVTLNNILGHNASQIYGQISANGQVFLSNPNGVYFSPTAQVNVGGLVATTGKANADEFMAGKVTFNRDGSIGSVVNEGRLSAAAGGYIALLAPEVRNQGVVIAQAGTVALASGEVITLNFNHTGTGLAGITTTPQAIAALVENRSAVLAEGGQIILSAHALASLQGSVVKNSGQLSATSLSTQGGKIVLMADSIALTGTSQIQASGATGGGTVLVGGDWQGTGDMRQATQVTMAQGASIEANATGQGDGGKVVLWSDVNNANSVTQVEGRIEAKGAGSADKGGNGGQVETSGYALNVGEQLSVSTQATGSGAAGQWLLDPANITINSTANSGQANSGGTFSPSSGAGTSIINTATLQSALDATNITITTTNTGASGGSTGTITIGSTLIWTSANQLTLLASGGLTGSAGIVTGATGSNLTIDQAGTSTYSGVISGSGSVTKLGAGALTLSGASTYTGGTTVTAGTLVIGATGALGTGGVQNNANLQFNAGASALTVVNDIAGSGLVQQSGTGVTTVSGNNSTTGSTLLSAGTLLLNSANALGNGGAITFGGGVLKYSANNTTDYSARLDTTTTGQAYKVDTNGQDITWATGFGAASSTLEKQGAGTLLLTAANTYDGLTTVRTGILAVAHADALGSKAAGTNVVGSNTTGGGAVLDLRNVDIGNEDVTLQKGPAMSTQPESGGTLRVSTGSSALSGALSVALQANIDVSGTRLRAVNMTEGSTNSWVNKQGTGLWELTGTNASFASAAASINILAGTLKLPGNASLGNGTYAGSITNSGTLHFDTSAAQSISGLINGTGTIIKDQVNTLALSGNSTGTGTFNINAGTVTYYSAGAFAVSNPNITISSGASLQVSGFSFINSTGTIVNNGAIVFSGTGVATTSAVISGTGTLTKDTGTNTWALTGANTFTGDVTLSAGSLALTMATGAATSGNFNHTSAGTFSLKGTFTQTGVMSGTGTYQVTSGAVTLGGANNFTSDLLVSNSTVRLGADSVPVAGSLSANPLGLGNVSLQYGGVLDLQGHDATLAIGKVLKSSTSTQTFNKLVNTTGTGIWRAPLSMSNTDIVNGFSLDVSSGAILQIAGVQNNGTATGAMSVTKTGAGTLQYVTPVGNSIQYVGGLYVKAGVLDFNSTTAQGPASNIYTPTVAAGAELKISAYNALSPWLSYNNSGAPYLNNSGTVTIASNSSSVYSGSGGVSGTGALVFTGGGLIRVGSNRNNPTGSVTIQAGTTVEMDAGFKLLEAAPANSTVMTNVQGTLKVNASGTFDYANNISGTGTLQIASGNVGLSRSTSGFTGTTQIDSGATLMLNTSLNPGAFLASVAGPIVDNGTLLLSNSGTYTVPNAISGTGGITLNSLTSNVSLSGTLSYGGTTTLTKGTLRLTGSTAYTGTGNFTMASGTTLSYESSASSTLPGSVTGAGTLVVNASAGTLILTSNSNSLNTVTLTSGTLQVGNGGSTGVLGASAIPTVSGSLVINRSDSYALGSILSSVGSSSGNISMVSGGDLTINKALTFNGNSSLIEANASGNLLLGAVTLTNSGTTGQIKLSANGGITFASASVLNASGTSGSLVLSAGANLLAGDTTAGKDIDLSAVTTGTPLKTAAGGTLTVFQGQANTVALSAMMLGASATKQYKTYGATVSSLSSVVSGTRNFYYRAAGSSITVSGASATKTYDGTTNANGYTTGGTVAGLSGEEAGLTGVSLAYSTATFNDPNAGTGIGLTLDGVSISTASWGISGLTASVSGGSAGTINKADLQLTGSKTYDGTTAIPGVGLTAVGVHSESFTVTGVGDASNLASPNVQSGSTLSSVTGLTVGASIGANAGLASNYNSLVTTASLVSVGRATATLTANKIYDASLGLSGSQLQITGVTVGGVNQTLGYTGTASIYDVNVATANNYVATGTLSLTNGTGLASNYVMPAYAYGAHNTASVSPATVSISAVKTYDGTPSLSAGQVTITGVGGQTLGYAGTAALQFTNVVDNATNFVKGLSGLVDNGSAVASNYQLPSLTVASANNTVTLSKADLTAFSASKTYDRLLTVTAAQISSVSGINGEIFTVASGTANINDKNVNTAGKHITSLSGLTLNGVNGSLSSNYNLSSNLPAAGPSNSVTITAKPITISGITVADKVYDRTNTATVSATNAVGWIPGDDVVVQASGSFADAAAASSKTVTLTYANTGTDLSNYSITTPPTATAAITPKPLGLNVPGASRMYDGTTSISPTGVITLSGVVGTDDVGVGTGNVTGFVDKNVGTNKQVTYTGFSLSGTTASNYSLPTNPVSSANITVADLQVNGVGAASRVYNAGTNATLTGAATVSPFLSDVVAVDASAATGSFADKNVGNGKPVTVLGFSLSGTDAGNYNVLQPTGVTANITPASLQVSGVSAVSRVYNAGTNVALTGTATVSPLLTDAVTVDASAAVVSFANKNVGTGKPVTATGYALTGSDAGNYSLVQPTGLTANISQLDVQITGVSANSRAYNGNTTASLTGTAALSALAGDVVSVDASGAAGTFADKNIGTGKAVTATGYTLTGSDAGNYNPMQPIGLSANINMATLLISGITVNNKTYDGNTNAITNLTGIVKTGLQGGDQVTVSATGTFDTTSAGTGKTVTLISTYGGDAGNYSITSQSTASANIDPKALALNIPGATRVYNGTTSISPSGPITLSGVIGLDDVTLGAGNVTGFVDKNVGTNKPVVYTGFSLVGTNAGNYSLPTQAASTADITKADLQITGVGAANKVYNANTTANLTGTAAVTALAGDVVSVSAGSAAGTFADKNVGTGKAVTVSGYTLSGADAGNYNVFQPTGVTADITSATLQVTGISAANKVYNANTTATLSGSATVAALGSDVVGVAGMGAGIFANKNVGNAKVVTVSGYTLTGADAGNYHVVQPTGVTADITAVSLQVTGVSATDKIYNANTTASLSGTAAVTALAGDVLSVTGTGAGTFADKNVGTSKAVAVTGYSLTGADAGNYTVVQPAGVTANITAADLQVTGVGAANKVYNANTAAVLNGTAVVTPLVGDDVAVAGNGKGTFANKNVGTGKAVTVSGFTLLGSDAGNYQLLQPTGMTADITAADLQVTGVGAANMVYNANTTATLTGTAQVAPLASDVVTLSSGSASAAFADKNVGTGKPVTATGYALSGADSSNYHVVQPTGLAANITPASLQVSGISAVNKVYDGSTGATLTGTAAVAALGSDVVTVSGTGTASFADKNAGNGKPVTATGYALSGADSVNYTVLQPSGLSANIAQAQLTISGIAASNKAYDGLLDAVVSTAGVVKSGLIAGDMVTVSSTGVFADKNAGNGKTVNLTNSYGGADLGNYNISNQSTATANITPAALTMTAQNASKLIGLADPAFTATYSGFVNGETSAVLSGVGVTRTGTDTVANTYTGVLVPSATSSNYTITPVNGNFTIVPADTLLVTLANGSKAYGASVIGLAATSAQYVTQGNVLRTVTLTPGVNGQYTYSDGLGTTGSFIVTTTASSNSSVGNYGITLSNFVKSGTNFTAQTSQDGNLLVNPLAVTLGAVNVSKVYDGNTGAQTSIAVANKVGADDVSVQAVGNYTDNKNVGTTHTYSLSTQLAGAAAANYYLGTSSVTGADGVITPAALTISGITAATKVYDGTTAATVNAAGVSKTGLIGGDVVTVSATGVFADKNVGTAKNVALSSSYGGADLANYTITDQASTSANITPAPLAISGITAANKVYDSTTDASVNTANLVKTGLIGSDVVTVSVTGSFADKDVGTGKTVNLIATQAGADALNYTVAGQSSALADITRAPLQVRANNASKTYDGQAYIGGNDVGYTGLVNGETGAVLGGTLAFGGTSQGATNAGNYAITPSGLTSSNYTITYQDGSLTINPAPMVATPTITKADVLSTASSFLPAVRTLPEAGDKTSVVSFGQGPTYAWPPGKTMDVPEKLDAGLLAITFLHAPDAATVASAIAFEQDADTISVRTAAAPLVHHGSDKVVFSSKMTEFIVANANGRMVEFVGGMINRRLVIVAPSDESKQLAKSETTMVLAAAVMALGKSTPIMLAKLEGVIFDLR